MANEIDTLVVNGASYPLSLSAGSTLSITGLTVTGTLTANSANLTEVNINGNTLSSTSSQFLVVATGSLVLGGTNGITVKALNGILELVHEEGDNLNRLTLANEGTFFQNSSSITMITPSTILLSSPLIHIPSDTGEIKIGQEADMNHPARTPFSLKLNPAGTYGPYVTLSIGSNTVSLDGRNFNCSSLSASSVYTNNLSVKNISSQSLTLTATRTAISCADIIISSPNTTIKYHNSGDLTYGPHLGSSSTPFNDSYFTDIYFRPRGFNMYNSGMGTPKSLRQFISYNATYSSGSATAGSSTVRENYKVFSIRLLDLLNTNGIKIIPFTTTVSSSSTSYPDICVSIGSYNQHRPYNSSTNTLTTISSINTQSFMGYGMEITIFLNPTLKQYLDDSNISDSTNYRIAGWYDKRSNYTGSTYTLNRYPFIHNLYGSDLKNKYLNIEYIITTSTSNAGINNNNLFNVIMF